MQIGLMFEGQNGLNWDIWKEILEIADTAGFQSVFRSDHFTNASGEVKDALELWTSLTYAAANTKNIEFGSLVTPITFRHPAIMAQNAAAVSVLSEGRLVLGVGAGWQEREHNAFDIHFPPLSERYERLQDGLEIVTQLLRSDESVTYEGKHFQLKDAYIKMKRTDIKLLLGGNSAQIARYAAQYGDEWNMLYINQDDFKQRNELLNGYLEEAGRKPEDVKRSLMIRVLYGKDEEQLSKRLEGINSSKEDLKARGIIVGTGSECVDILGQWQEAGLERIMLQWIEFDDLASLEDLAQDVLPHFHN